jgi:hypothetical protein
VAEIRDDVGEQRGRAYGAIFVPTDNLLAQGGPGQEQRRLRRCLLRPQGPQGKAANWVHFKPMSSFEIVGRQ